MGVGRVLSVGTGCEACGCVLNAVGVPNHMGSRVWLHGMGGRCGGSTPAALPVASERYQQVKISRESLLQVLEQVEEQVLL